VRGFLQKTVGFFADPAVALVQTAQHFFNPDPFERNLKLTGKIAPEQHFFYHAIQPANDFWNSAFFCGSCAVLRRSAVKAIGGFKTTTVTEDAHTSLELHARGYRSVYLPMALAAGLATETYRAHVVQRVRWARGMAQILRTDCPLFKRGLSIPQRINYFSAMFHFFFGVPTLIMLLAPLTYLLFGVHPIKADALAVVAYILPHIGLCTLANSIISKNFRHSFWSGVYEMSIAPYVALATFLAMVYPRKGKFNVTEKGANLEDARFDFKTGGFTLALIALSVCGLMIAFPIRLILHAYGTVDPTELNSLILNSAWAMANLVTLVAAACVAYEQPQQRRAPRMKRNLECQITVGSEPVRCRSVDLSENGIKLVFDREVTLPHESTVHISSGFGARAAVPAALIRSEWNASGRLQASFRFVGLGAEQYRNIVQLLFSGDESWTGRSYARDRVLRSCWYLATTLWRVNQPRTPAHANGKIWSGEFDKQAAEVSNTL
jgi:cellulose synthase (UDP-forming)